MYQKEGSPEHEAVSIDTPGIVPPRTDIYCSAHYPCVAILLWEDVLRETAPPMYPACRCAPN